MFSYVSSQIEWRVDVDQILTKTFSVLFAKMADTSIFKIIGEFSRNYSATTPKLLKMIDVFLGYILLTGIIQFVYCALVGTFPFNSFLSGFISTVGSFILTGNSFTIAQI